MARLSPGVWLARFRKDGHPHIPSPSQQCKRGKQAGAPLPEALFILSVLTGIRSRLIGARDLIIDSAPILAWHRADPDAADRARACSTSPSALDVCYRVHTLIYRGSGLPLFFLLSPANAHDAPFARPLLAWAVRLYQIRPRFIRLDAASVGIASHHLDSCDGWRAVAVIPWNPKRQKNRFWLPPTWTKEELGKRSGIERFLGRAFLFFHLQRPPLVFLVHYGSAGLLDLHGHHHRRSRCPAGWPPRSHPISQTRFSSCMGGFLSYEMPSLVLF